MINSDNNDYYEENSDFSNEEDEVTRITSHSHKEEKDDDSSNDIVTSNKNISAQKKLPPYRPPRVPSRTNLRDQLLLVLIAFPCRINFIERKQLTK